MKNTTQSQAEVEDFLRRFRRGLAALPDDIREDLVDEVRSHIKERFEQGQFDLAGDFGLPEEYASCFVNEQILGTAVTRGRPWELVIALLAVIPAIATAVFVILPLAVVELAALALVLVGVAKPLASDHIGLFRMADGSFGGLGWIGNTTSMHEVLGLAAMPLFLFAGLLLFWIGNRLLLKVAHWELVAIRSRQTNSNSQER